MRPVWSRRVAGLGALALLAVGAQAPRSAEAAVPPGKLSGEAFAPSGPGAAAFGPDAALACPTGGPTRELQKEIEKAGLPVAPQAEGALCAIAETFLGWTRAGAPPEPVTRAVAAHFGVATPLRPVVITLLQTLDARDVAEALAPTLKQLAEKAVAPRFGLAAQAQGERGRQAGAQIGSSGARGVTRVVLVVRDAELEVAGVPRQLPPGGSATLSAKVPAGVSDARVLVSDPVGRFVSTPAAGDAVQARLECGEKPGRVYAEVRGKHGGAPALLARFAVSCGEAPPSQVAIPQPLKAPVDGAALEKRLMLLVNAERAAAGLPELAWSDAVAGVARRSAASYLAQSQGAAGGFDLAGGLRQAGVGTLLVNQSPVAASSAEELFGLLAQAPQNRANALDPRVTHAAIGVAASADPERPVAYAVGLFVREQPPIDAEAARARLREAIAKKRQAAGADPMAADPVLEDVAQKFAAELAATSGAPPKERESAILAPLYSGYATVNLTPGVKPDPLDLAEEPGAVAAARVMGVGVAQGQHPEFGKNAVYVVLVTATPREPAKPASKPAAKASAPAKPTAAPAKPKAKKP